MHSFSIHTFGCQMNSHDSDRMAEVLVRSGYHPAAPEEPADIMILNTCSVREKAEHKLRSEVGRVAVLKRTRPELLLVVAGCVAQQEGELLLRAMPAIDVLIGPDNIAELPHLLAEQELGGPPRARTEFDVVQPSFLRAEPLPGWRSATAFVTTMKGCNERCTYCIVPYTRGPERYRSAREIVEEVERLVEAGAKEVTLLGQTVNSYRDPEGSLAPAPGAGDARWRHTSGALAKQDESEFPALLRAIAARVPGLARLRYTSPHPRHLTPSLILAHAELPVLVRHLHLPVQSGSDAVLRRMLRRYSVAEYLERTDALKQAVPGLTLSTDVIVGFPGETREDFEGTLALVARAEFSSLFGFMYSVRPYTPAQRLEDDVPEAEKSARLAELFALSERQRSSALHALVGSVQRVLVEGPGRQGGYTGRNERNEIVHFGARRDVTGELVDVRVVRAFKHSLEAEALEPELLAALPQGAQRALRSLPVLSS